MPHYEPVGRKPFTTPPGSRTTSRKNSMHDATRPSLAADSSAEMPPLPDLLAETIKNLRDTEVERGRQREARQPDPDAPLDRPDPLWEDGSRAGRRGRSVSTRDKVAMWEERSRSRSMGRSKSRRRYLDDPNRVSIVPEIPDLELALEKAQESHREVQNSPLAKTGQAQVADRSLPSSPSRGPVSPVEESQRTPTQAEYPMPSTPVHAERIAQATTPPPESPTSKIPTEALPDGQPLSVESRADTPPPTDAAPTDLQEPLESVFNNTSPPAAAPEYPSNDESLTIKDLPTATEAAKELSEYPMPAQEEPVEHLKHPAEPSEQNTAEELTETEPTLEKIKSAPVVAADPLEIEDRAKFIPTAQDEAAEEPVLVKEPSEFIAPVHEETQEELVLDERLSEQISPVPEIEVEGLGAVPDETAEQLPPAEKPSEPAAEPSEPTGELAEHVTSVDDAPAEEVPPAEDLLQQETPIQEITLEEIGLAEQLSESIVLHQDVVQEPVLSEKPLEDTTLGQEPVAEELGSVEQVPEHSIPPQEVAAEEPVFAEESSEQATLGQEATLEEPEPVEQILEQIASPQEIAVEELEHADAPSHHIMPTQEELTEELGTVEEPLEQKITVQAADTDELEHATESTPPVQGADLEDLEPAEEPSETFMAVQTGVVEQLYPAEELSEPATPVQDATVEETGVPEVATGSIAAVEHDSIEMSAPVEEPSEPIPKIQREVEQLELTVEPSTQFVSAQDEDVGELVSTEEPAEYITAAQEATVEQTESETQSIPEPEPAPEISSLVEGVRDEDEVPFSPQFEQPSDTVALDTKVEDELEKSEEIEPPAAVSLTEDQLDTSIESTQESELPSVLESAANPEDEEDNDTIYLPTSQNLESELDQTAQKPVSQVTHESSAIQDSEAPRESSAVVDTVLADPVNNDIGVDLEGSAPQEAEIPVDDGLQQEADEREYADGAEDPEKISHDVQFDHGEISGADESQEEADSNAEEAISEPLADNYSMVTGSQDRTPSPSPDTVVAIEQEPIESLASSAGSVAELATTQEETRLSNSTIEIQRESAEDIDEVQELERIEPTSINTSGASEQEAHLVENVDDLGPDASHAPAEAALSNSITYPEVSSEEGSASEKDLDVPPSSEELSLDKEPLDEPAKDSPAGLTESELSVAKIPTSVSEDVLPQDMLETITPAESVLVTPTADSSIMDDIDSHVIESSSNPHDAEGEVHHLEPSESALETDNGANDEHDLQYDPTTPTVVGATPSHATEQQDGQNDDEHSEEAISTQSEAISYITEPSDGSISEPITDTVLRSPEQGAPEQDHEIDLSSHQMGDISNSPLDSYIDVEVPNSLRSGDENESETPREDSVLGAEFLAETEASSSGVVSQTEDNVTKEIVNNKEILIDDSATQFSETIVDSEVATELGSSPALAEAGHTQVPFELPEPDDRDGFDSQPDSPVESEAFRSALATPADSVFPIDHSDTESVATVAQSEASDSTHRPSPRLSAAESLNGDISAEQLPSQGLSELHNETLEVQEHYTPITSETGSHFAVEPETPDAFPMEIVQPDTMGPDVNALTFKSMEISGMPLEPEEQKDIPDSQETSAPSQGPEIVAREDFGEQIKAPVSSAVEIASPIALDEEADVSLDIQEDTLEISEDSLDVIGRNPESTDQVLSPATNESQIRDQEPPPAHEDDGEETIQPKEDTSLDSVELLSDQESAVMERHEPQEVNPEVEDIKDIEDSEHVQIISSAMEESVAPSQSPESEVELEVDQDADEGNRANEIAEAPKSLEVHELEENSVLETAGANIPEDLESQMDNTTSALNPNRASKDSGIELREQDEASEAGEQAEDFAAKDKMAAAASLDHQTLERASPEPVDERFETQLVRDSGVGLMGGWEAEETVSSLGAQEETVAVAEDDTAAPSAGAAQSPEDFSSDGFDDDAPEIAEVSSEPSIRPSTPVQQVRQLANNPPTPEATPDRGNVDKSVGEDVEREVFVDALDRPSTPQNRNRAFPLFPPTPGSTPRGPVQSKSISLDSEERHAWAEQHTSNLATDEPHVSIAIAEEVLQELPSPKSPVVPPKLALELEPERGRRRTRDWTQDAAKVASMVSQDEAAEPPAPEEAPALPPRKPKGSNHGMQGYQMPGEIDVSNVPPPSGPPPASSVNRVPARSASRPPAYQRQDAMQMPQPPAPAMQLSATAAPYQPREAPKKYPAPPQPVAGVSGFNIPPPPEPAYTDGRTSRAPSKARSKSRGRKQGGRNQSRHQSRPRRHPWDAPPVIERALHAAAVGVMQGFSAPMDLYRTVRDVYYPPPGRPDIVKSYEVRARLPIRIFFPSHHDGFSQALLPTLFTIHGGAFTIGSAADDDVWNRNFADSFSTLVVALNYAKAPWAGFPCPLLDVEALYHAVMNDESIPIDKNRTALAGFDAGANLALTLAQLPSVKTGVSPNAPVYPYPQHLPYPAPKAAISICGILDFAMPSGAKARTRPYKRQLRGIRGWGPGLDWMMRILPSSAWSYIPYGHDVMDPLLSPLYARRADLPPHLFVVGAELDCLAHESWRAACTWAGRPVPTSNILVGRRNPSRWRGGLDDGAGENALKFAWEESGNGMGGEGSTRWLLVPDVVHGFDCAGWRAQYMWADEEGRVDSEMKTFAYQRELATWLWGTVWREEIRPWR